MYKYIQYIKRGVDSIGSEGVDVEWCFFISVKPRETWLWRLSGTDVSSAFAKPATTTTKRETRTFVNCMRQMRTYHYFEIVYVKVIFLHVGCCYFVFRKCVVFVISFLKKFFVIRRKKNSLCVETCHIENVVRSKAKKHHVYIFLLQTVGWESNRYDNSLVLIISLSFFLLYFWGGLCK